MRLWNIFLLLVFSVPVYGQADSSARVLSLADYRIEPILSFQIWGSHSHGTEVFRAGSQSYEPAGDRTNVMIRRTRFGFRARPHEDWKVVFVASADMVGRDVLSGQTGGMNNGSLPTLGVWNAYVRWSAFKGKETLIVTAGYLSPPLGRESNQSGLRVSSMEKASSQSYIRRHLAGTGSGRASGINAGGLLSSPGRRVSWSYDLGIFNPVSAAFDGNSTGMQFSPLLVGRFVIHFGDPEMDFYGSGLRTNYFGRRRGLSVGMGGSIQGTTSGFDRSLSAAVDLLFNYDAWNVDAELFYMQREGDGAADAVTGHARISYHWEVPAGPVLEPALMWYWYAGEDSVQGQTVASSLGISSGLDMAWDAGINWHMNSNWKLSFHYTWRKGELGDAPDGSGINDYFNQKPVGPIRRGNWLGLGLVVIL